MTESFHGLARRLAPFLREHPTSEPGGVFFSVSEADLAPMAREEDTTLADLMARALDQDIWPERFRSQRGTYTAGDQARLLRSSAAIIGAGGLGGTVASLLARVGVGRLVVCDGDRFEESNLNRQWLSDPTRLGRGKAECAAETIAAINPAVTVQIFSVWAGPENLPEILAGTRVVVDCLDNLATRYEVQASARVLGIPFVHGALAGEEGMLLTVFPGDPGLEALYGPTPPVKSVSAESFLGTPTVTPTVVAGIQAAEAINILLDRPTLARGRMIHLDLTGPSLDFLALG